MMDEINWNEAPEGATHWSARESLDRRWHKIEAGTLYFFGSQRRWIEYMSDTIYVTAIRESLIPRPVASQIPPVGTVCEAFWSGDTEPAWREWETLAISEKGVAAKIDNEEITWFDYTSLSPILPDKFRPVQTEEELTVEDLSIILANNHADVTQSVKDSSMFIGPAKAIYKAGYRKENI